MAKQLSKKAESGSPKARQFEVLVNEEFQTAKFANSVKIWHTPFEFYLDFGQFVPGTNKIKVNARMVITPQHALNLRAALSDNIAKYEARFGKIASAPPHETAPKEASDTDEGMQKKKHVGEYIG